MTSIDEFHLWIDRENMWNLQKFLVLWGVACCLYASAKIGGKIHDKLNNFLSGLDVKPKISFGISWIFGQLGMLASIIACLYSAIAFSCSEDSLINIKARQTLTGIMSYWSDEQKIAAFAHWLREEANWKDWE